MAGLIKRLTAAIVAAVTVVSVASCGTMNNTKSDNSNAAIHFTDDDGRLIELDKPADKIISLYSAHTENLYYLGAGDKVIGGYKTCVYPPEAAFSKRYDYSGDPEAVIAAEPDLVLIRPFITKKSPGFVKALEKAGICVVSLYPGSLDKFDEYIDKLAVLAGVSADEELDEFHRELDSVKAASEDIAPKKNVFFEATEVDIRTVTPNSMAGRAITYAGGMNIAADAKPMESGSTIASFGAEKVLENADKIDVYVSQRGAMNSGGNLISIGERAGYNTIKAVKENNVFLINEKLVSSPSFRYVKGVKELARFFYPEIFDSCDDLKSDEIASRRDLAEIVVKTQHMPIYVPSSSSYYTTDQKGHTFGLFEDVKWYEDGFDAVETAVESGVMDWEKKDGKEYFNPQQTVTRDELANTVFMLGDFSPNGKNTLIDDLSECGNSRIIQILVDNGVFELDNGSFNPNREVSCREVIEFLEKLSE